MNWRTSPGGGKRPWIRIPDDGTRRAGLRRRGPAKAMKVKHVPSARIEREGRRLDCGPYLSGALEAQMRLEGLPGACVELCSLTQGHDTGIYNGPQFARKYVVDPAHGVPFLSSSSMLHADFTHADLLKKTDTARFAYLRIEEGMTLVSRSGTIGRMVCSRPEMVGMWGDGTCGQDRARVQHSAAYAA